MTTKIWLPKPLRMHSNIPDQTAFLIEGFEDIRQSLLEIGLVQTEDTGQFNPLTWTAPTDEPYLFNTWTHQALTNLVFRFDDDLAETAPIYIKITFARYIGQNFANGYGVGGFVTVGTGSNGAGVITNPVGSATGFMSIIGSGENVYTTDYSNQSWACHSKEKGFLGYMWNPGKIHNGPTYCSPLSFFIERIPDDNGVPTATGFTVWARHQWNNVWNYCSDDTYVSAVSYTAMTRLTPSNVTYTNVGESYPWLPSIRDVATPDLFMVSAVHTTPMPVRSLGMGHIFESRLAHGTEFDVQVYGLEDSRFVAMGKSAGMRPSTATGATVPVFLFE